MNVVQRTLRRVVRALTSKPALPRVRLVNSCRRGRPYIMAAGPDGRMRLLTW